MNKLKLKDLSKILKPYHNVWVALARDEKKVVSSGKTLKEALEKAEEKGIDDPIMTKIPKKYGNFVL